GNNAYVTDDTAVTLVDDTTSPGQPYTNSAVNSFFFTDSAAGGIDTAAGSFGTITASQVTLVATGLNASIGSIANGVVPLAAGNVTLQASNGGSVYASDNVAATLVDDTTSPGQPFNNTATNQFFFEDTAVGGIDTAAGTFGTITGANVTLDATQGSIGSAANGVAPLAAGNVTLQATNGSVF